jgi:hypothetical protein
LEGIDQAGIQKKKTHSRLPSLDIQKPMVLTFENPEEKAKYNLVNDYGAAVD